MLKGISASPGYGAGPLLVIRPRPELHGRRSIAAGDVSAELARLAAAVEATRARLQALETRTLEQLGAEKAQIFAAHQLFLDDPEFVGGMQQQIEGELVAAETAVAEVTEQLAAMLAALDDEYLRERAADVRDVGGQVLDHLLGAAGPDWDAITEPVVLAAHDLTPSDTAQLDRAKVKAIVTAIGGRTSHSAIMARSLGIPAVVGVTGLLEQAHEGQMALVDAQAGTVTLDPAPEAVASFGSLAEAYERRQTELQKLKDLPSITADGHQVEVSANIGRPADVEKALASGAEGVGLFRSEFLYMDRSEMPSEEEQYQAYRQVAEGMGGRPVIIRTLDIGGDKELPYLELPKEMNPFLGVRAVRLCLQRPDLFQTQLRAILRASAHGKVLIMFPMIATLGELRAAKEQVRVAMAALRERGQAFNEQVPVGIMVEVPAAALNAPALAREADFFSIGTNDLVQYTMACDRINEQVSYLYQPFEPAVLRLIKMVIDAARAEGKWTGMCGEMAGDPLATPLLLGLGLHEFSMSAVSVLPVREAVRRTSMAHAQEIAAQALSLSSAEEVRAYLASVQ